jgi:hypothetical protein
MPNLNTPPLPSKVNKLLYCVKIYTDMITIGLHFIVSSSKELTSWVKLQVEIFCKASSLEDDNVFVFCVVFF